MNDNFVFQINRKSIDTQKEQRNVKNFMLKLYTCLKNAYDFFSNAFSMYVMIYFVERSFLEL